MPVGRGVLTIDGMTQHTRLRYANPDQDLDQTGRTWIHSLESSLDVPLTEKWTAAAGLSGSAARAHHPRLRATAHQEHIAAFAEGTGTHGRLHLYPALRTDLYWMSDGGRRTAVSPRLGINWRPVPGWSRIRVKGQLGRAFRLPTFNDRYWQPGGNPDLRPERSWGGDMGLWIGDPTGHAELTAFGHRRRAQIVWRPTGDGYWGPDNVGRVRALGFEASASWGWTLSSTAALQSGLTYTVTDARNRSDPDSPSYNEPVLYVPRDQLKAHSTLSWGPAALAVHARYTGRRPTSSDGRQFLDEYVIARTQFRFERSIEGVQAAFSLEVDNVFNTDYRTIGYRPMPPRHARVAIDLAL
jgi:iron complex outermembrane receptor protein